MRKTLFALIALLITVPAVWGETGDPFVFNAPKEWRSERIPFPLDFAPELDYQGFEELRFAPGMFNDKSDSYFSYVFFWWIDGKSKINAERLEADLVNYFKGLCSAVGKQRKLTLDLTKVRAKVAKQADKPSSTTQHFTGVVDTFDPFTDGKPLTLNFEISERHCEQAGRLSVFFIASPQQPQGKLWETMRAMRDTFACSQPGK